MHLEISLFIMELQWPEFLIMLACVNFVVPSWKTFNVFAVCSEDHGRLLERRSQGLVSYGHRDPEVIQGPVPQHD